MGVWGGTRSVSARWGDGATGGKAAVRGAGTGVSFQSEREAEDARRALFALCAWRMT